MAGNTIGILYRLTTFGESHGKAVGGIIDGCPAGIDLDFEFIQRELDRRKPGQSAITTQRKEQDKVEFLSGIFEGKTTGAPIGFVIWNSDHRSKDYDNLRKVYRPSHADYTYYQKYGIREHSGGGRSSARITIPRVVAGAVAKLIINKLGIEIAAFTSQVGHIKLEQDYTQLDLSNTESNAIRCPDNETANRMISLVESIKKQDDTVGGIITGVIKNAPIGLGEPEFDKFHAELGKNMLNINAVKGFQIGSGFDAALLKGSSHNDLFIVDNEKVKTKTNFSGGVQGGITNGMDIVFKVAFKPVATILKPQKTIDTELNELEINPKGRHDPCVLPRAVPIVESMAAMTVLDFYLRNLAIKL